MDSCFANSSQNFVDYCFAKILLIHQMPSESKGTKLLLQFLFVVKRAEKNDGCEKKIQKKKYKSLIFI